MWYLRIPRERVAILIGTEGKVKRRIEGATGVSMAIDSEAGEVTIDHDRADPLLALKAQDIVKAIGRGFSPGRALVLLSDEAYLEMIDIRDYAGKNPGRIRELKGRVIGRSGRTRQLIEEYTDVELSVYGNTIAIIGHIDAMDSAKHALDMLLCGARHGSVYKYLEKRRKESRRRDFQDLITG